MSPELDKKLCEKYPALFRDRYASVQESCMAWGFDVGDGWYDIIEKLCQVIMEIADRDGLDPFATQVKEKFGTLRFYISGANDEIYNAIDRAEMLTEHTCEKCGKPGQMRSMAWIKVLCDEHYEENVK